MFHVFLGIHDRDRILRDHTSALDKVLIAFLDFILEIGCDHGSQHVAHGSIAHLNHVSTTCHLKGSDKGIQIVVGAALGLRIGPCREDIVRHVNERAPDAHRDHIALNGIAHLRGDQCAIRLLPPAVGVRIVNHLHDFVAEGLGHGETRGACKDGPAVAENGLDEHFGERDATCLCVIGQGTRRVRVVHEDTIHARGADNGFTGGRHARILGMPPCAIKRGEDCIDRGDHEEHVRAFEGGADVETGDGDGHSTER